MSVSATGSSSLPDPGFYGYPSSASASSPAQDASGGAPAAAAPAQSSYQTAYDNLLQQDTADLLQVSFGSSSDAQANIASVLAQATALQQQQLAAQRQAQTAAAPAIAAPSAPTLTSVIQQSDGNAASDLSNGTLGASIDTSA